MKRLYFVPALLCCCALAGWAQNPTFESSEYYNPILPAGSVYSATFIHDATTMPRGYALIGPVDVSYERFQSASVQVSSNSATSGVIFGATFAIYASIQNTKSMTANVLIDNSTYTKNWTSLPQIRNYGIYNFPLHGMRYLWIYANGVDDVTRMVEIGLR